jgi:hypothetical protein
VSTDKRDSDRVRVLGDLRGEVTIFQPMTVKEISGGGAQIETAFPLQVDSLHDFRLSLGERSVVVKARVAHCRITDVDQDLVLYLSGVEFVEPTERVRSAIAEFMAILKGARQPGSARG